MIDVDEDVLERAVTEWRLLMRAGLADAATGNVHCRECGAVVPRREDGPLTTFECRCGWRVELSASPGYFKVRPCGCARPGRWAS